MSGILTGDRGGDLAPVFSLCERLLRFLCLFLRGREDLLDFAAFGKLKLVLALVVFFLQLGLGNLDVFGKSAGPRLAKSEAAVFRGAEHILVRVIK